MDKAFLVAAAVVVFACSGPAIYRWCGRKYTRLMEFDRKGTW